MDAKIFFKLGFVDNKILENGVLIDGGYIEGTTYHYYLTDHLGNNRVVANASGGVVQKTHYYPFGMAFAETLGETKQPYKYNGKELDTKHGLNTYDYSARYYDPGIGRFTSVDPLAEKFYSWSPYVYCFNNPLRFIDIDGRAAWIGALVGGAIDYGFQVGINYVSGIGGVEAWTNVDLGSIAISAAAGATGVGLAGVVGKGIAATKVVQNGSKVMKVASVVATDAAVGATVSAGSQLAKDGKVEAKDVAVDAVASTIAGQVSSKVKGMKQNSQQGKVYQREADHYGRVAGTAEGRTLSRPSRIQKAQKATQKANDNGNKSAAAGTAGSNSMSKIYKENENREE